MMEGWVGVRFRDEIERDGDVFGSRWSLWDEDYEA